MTVVVTHTTPADSTFSSTGAAAWNADHTLSGVGTMAEQDANNVAISGGNINNTVIGGTTPAAGTFTTLTATGQTSLGGAAGSEGLRVVTSTGSNDWIQVNGSNFGRPVLRSASASGNTSLGLSSQGTGVIQLYTNTSAQEQARIAHTASAVNYVQVTGAATTASPVISAQGSDTNIPLTLNSKGNNGIIFQTRGAGTPRVALQLLDSGSASVNYSQIQSNITGAGPIWSALGTDTNIDLNLTTKGTGSFKINNAGGTVAEFNDGGAANPTNSFLFAAGGGGIRALIRAMGGPMTLLSTGTNPVNFATNGSSGNIQAVVSHTASAVNYVQVTGAVTGGRPIISSEGSDTNVNFVVASKGTGSISLRTNTTTTQLSAIHTASAVNYHQFTGAVTGFGPVHQAQGSDTDIPLVLSPKGTGALQAQQTDSTATGGNARGANAVDWQTARNNAAYVASGSYSVIGGGYANTSSASYSGVFSGLGNTSNGIVAVTVGGQSNVSTGSYSAVVGGIGNTSFGQYSFAGAGQNNTSNGFYNAIVGGFTNSGTSNSAVTTQSATMNGTTAVTLSGSNANIKVGQYITGTSISGDTYVAAISGTSLTLSKVASGSSTSTLSFYTPHGVVVGGGNNQATGSYSFIGGGGDAGTAAYRNVASGDWSVVGGGTRHIASGQYSSITGGYNNTSSGIYSSVAGGTGNSASGYAAGILNGASQISNGTLTAVIGGQFSTTRAISSNIVFGSNGPIAYSTGVSQAALLVLARQTTDATPTVLCSDNTAATTTNQVILPNNSAYYFRGEIVSGVTGGGNSKSWTIEGLIKRGADAAATTLVGSTVTSMFADVGAATWAIALSADTTNGGLAVTFTGQAATTIRTVCQIRTTEMTY